MKLINLNQVYQRDGVFMMRDDAGEWVQPTGPAKSLLGGFVALCKGQYLETVDGGVRQFATEAEAVAAINGVAS